MTRGAAAPLAVQLLGAAAMVGLVWFAQPQLGARGAEGSSLQGQTTSRDFEPWLWTGQTQQAVVDFDNDEWARRDANPGSPT